MVRGLISVCFFALSISPLLAGETAPAPRYGGTLRIGVDGTIPAIDPYQGTRFRQHLGFTRFYAEGLVDVDKNVDMVPGLAESWEITPDGRDYTFKLKRGVKFHNGDELTAEDVKASFEHAKNPKSRAQYRMNLELMESIETLDRYTVKIRLKEPSTPFLSNIYGILIPVMSRKSLATLASHPVGTGPFMFEEWKSGLHLKLSRFKDYWKQGKPYVDELVIRFMPDDNVRFLALRSGDLEVADSLPPQMMAELKGSSQKGFQAVGIPGGSFMIFMMNNRRPPLNDVRVRQAIAFAIDKTEILNATLWGLGEATNQLVAKGSSWYFDVEDRKQDIAAARRLLAEAGFPQGFKTSIIVSPKYRDTAQILQSQLRAAGIQLEFDQVDDATRLARENKADFNTDLRGMGYMLDPDRYFTYFYSKTGRRNFTGYNNPEVDRLYKMARVERDQKKRKQMYTDLFRIVQKEVPEILLWSGYRFFGWRDTVKGFTPNGAGVAVYDGGGFETAWIRKR